MESPKTETFDSWAVVELMGHQQIAGHVTEQSIGGTAFIRVDVPEQPASTKRQQWDEDQPSIPAYTRYLSSGAIYAINPCTEAVAKLAAERMRARPPLPYDMPKTPLLERPDLEGPESSDVGRVSFLDEDDEENEFREPKSY